MGMDWDLCWISRFLFVTQYMVTLADIGFCVFFFVLYSLLSGWLCPEEKQDLATFLGIQMLLLF